VASTSSETMTAAEAAMGGAELPKKRKLLKDVTVPCFTPPTAEEKPKGEAVVDAITSTVKKLNPKKKK